MDAMRLQKNGKSCHLSPLYYIRFLFVVVADKCQCSASLFALLAFAVERVVQQRLLPTNANTFFFFSLAWFHLCNITVT